MDADDLIQQMNVYYAARAYLHDEFMGGFSVEDHARLKKPFLDIIIPQIKNKNLIELACGTGIWTAHLAQHAKSVLATDLNEQMLSLARKKLSDISNITFDYFDIYSPIQATNTFDIVFSADLFSHVPVSHYKSVLNTQLDLLTKSGMIIMTDMLPREMKEVVKWYHDNDGNNIGIRKLPDGSEYHVLKNYPSKEDLTELAESIGCHLEYFDDTQLQRWLVRIKKQAL